MTKKTPKKSRRGVQTIPAANQAKLAHYAMLLSTVSGNDVGTQRARLIAALKYGPVTTYEARKYLDIYDIYDACARAHELRKNEGLRIHTNRVSVETDAGVIHRRIGQYCLTGGAS